jgi:TM2 domain-containing membrane protein YozV
MEKNQMFCKNCANEIPNQAVVCVKCGCPTNAGYNFCYNCGKDVMPGAIICTSCGVPVANGAAKSKIAAGLLGIFLGGFGVHNFYLGNTGKAVAQLLMSVLSCGILYIVSHIWGLIEGIMILTGSINTDAKGIPLKD